MQYNLQHIEYKCDIKQIIHISDIHIHLYKRHEEYKEVFNKFLLLLQNEKHALTDSISNSNIPIICIITGDILHSKSDLSPECIQLTYQLFKDISNIMPCIIIPGNHDLNMNNKNRLDSLTPIISDLPNYNPIHYLNNTGIWKMSNLVFGHASIFDYNIIVPEYIDKLLETENIDSNKIIKVALYHGRINGVELYNGSKIDGELNSTTKKTITPSNFIGYDLSLFGDIHKHQFLDKNKSQGYAGSLIQQNFGEDIHNHGYIKWDIATLSGIFVDIPNTTGYYSFYLQDGKCDYLQKDGINITPTLSLPKNLRIRIFYSKTTHVQLEEFVSNLGRFHTVIEYSIQNVEGNISKVNNDGTLESISVDTVKEIDITDYKYQNALLRNIMIEDYEDIPECDIKEICLINQVANEKILSLDDDTIIPISSSKFKLIRLEFSNLFSYGSGNIVDFTNCRGIVGIIAPNHTGKSAILDILLFTIYDQFPRKGTAKDILNNRKSDFEVKLDLVIGSSIYTIIKSGKRNTTGNGVKCNTHFTRRNSISGRVEQLNQDTDKDTKKYITRFFGSYEDMINTNFSIQTDSTGFIDAENTARRKELERILKFDYINKLIKDASQEYKNNKTIFEHLQKNMPPELIISIKKDITEHESLLNKTLDIQTTVQTHIKTLTDKITHLNKNINPLVDSQIEELLNDLDLEKTDIINQNISTNELIKTKLLEYKTHKNELDTNIKSIVKRITTDISTLFTTSEYADKYQITPPNISNNATTHTNKHLLTKKDISSINTALTSFINKVNEDKKHISTQLQNINIQLKTHQNTIQQYTIFKKSAQNVLSYKYPVNLIKKLLNKIPEHPHAINPDGYYSIDNANANANAYNIRDDIYKFWFDCILELDKLEDQKKGLEVIKGKWEAKILKYESNIEELQCKNESLLTNDLPIFLKDEIKGTSIDKIMDNINRIETDILMAIKNANTNGNNLGDIIDPILLESYKNEIMLLGWYSKLFNIDKESSDITNTINKNRDTIILIKDKLSNAKESLKKKVKAITKLEGLTSLKEDIMEHIQHLDKDFISFKINKRIDIQIKDIDTQKEELQTLYLDDEIKDSITDIQKSILDYESIVIDIMRVKEQIKTIKCVEDDIAKLGEEGLKNTKLQEEIVASLEIKNNYEKQLSKTNLDVEILKDKISSLKGQVEQMQIQSKQKIEKERKMHLYSLYRDTMKMIPYKLISQIKPLLERKINDLLTVVTDFTLQFDITDSKIEIYLNRPSYKGRMIMIRNSSGFERFISSIAIRIALMEISQLSSPNMMAIDEGWSCFDNENIGNIGIILDHLKLKFDFILTISHMQLIRQNCDTQINLERDKKGFSKVQFGN